MANDKNIIKSTAEFTRSYSNMRGVNYSEYNSDDVLKRYGQIENMYVDYEGDADCLESIPGFRQIYKFDSKINGIYPQNLEGDNDCIIVHAGESIYRFSSASRDSLSALTPLANIKNSKSHSFTYGRDVYIMDGENFISIDKDGKAASYSYSGASCYVPTLYRNGERFEERNLLTDIFTEEIDCIETDKINYGTPGLVYQIIDENELTCRVLGSESQVQGRLHIPSYAKINGKSYRVIEIGDWAFSAQNGITELVTNPNLLTISRYAFMNCTGLVKVTLSETVKSVEAYGFFGCSSLSAFHIGSGFESFGSNMISKCDSLKELTYAADSVSYTEIKNQVEISERTVLFNTKCSKVVIAIPVYSKADFINKLTIGETDVENYSFNTKTGELILEYEDRLAIEGKSVRLYGVLNIEEGRNNIDSFFSSDLGADATPEELIYGCTVSAVFDGRIFLSGNSKFSGAVFYSSNDRFGNNVPNYFSQSSFFIDGAGEYPVSAMLSVNGLLAVFKSGDDGGGSIFYHTSKSVNDKITYPVTYIHGGINGVASAFTFLDDPIFLSPEGICAIEAGSGGDYKEIRCRSSSVGPRLKNEKLKDISFAEWRGYLAVLAEGRIYLADSRDRYKNGDSLEYEWYTLSGIGTYEGDEKVYRYATSSDVGFHIHENPDEIAHGVVLSVMYPDETFKYYVIAGDKKYSVYPTEEFTGGIFSPACAIASLRELLYFGTTSGSLCIFNNDKRGIAPDYISAMSDFDSEEYKKLYGNKLHPYFYSFDNHAPLYAIKTKSDSCDLPYLEKKTVPHSLTLKCKSFIASSMHTEVGTDGDGYELICSLPVGRTDFSELDFSSLVFDTDSYSTVRLPERKKNWCEKQISIYTNKFRSPIGVYSVTYRYKIKGIIKNQ